MTNLSPYSQGQDATDATLTYMPLYYISAAPLYALLGDSFSGPRQAIVVVSRRTVIDARLSTHGYRRAAEYLANQRDHGDLYLFDGHLDGDFIYQIRRQDHDRTSWVLRGDKLFYGFSCYPETDYREYVQTETAVLEKIFEYDPAFIIVDEPDPRDKIPMADRLRKILHAHPERFKFEASFSARTTRVNLLNGNSKLKRNYRIVLYRNTLRNSQPRRTVEFDVLQLGRSLKTNFKK